MTSENRTLANQAFDKIFDLILRGDLPLGGVVNEANLAQRFNISRGPIREAVQRLQGLRLVTREPYMRARVVVLSGRDLVEIFQLREAAEGMACRLATKVMHDNELDQLAADLKRGSKGVRAGRSRQKSANSSGVLDLHIRIARGCGNRRLEQLLCGDLYHLLRIYRARSGALPGRHEQAVEEHWQIIRAMQARDPALAESLMRAHIGRATQTLLNSLDKIDGALDQPTGGQAA